MRITNLPPVPIPANERERLGALQSYGVLDTAPEAAYDAITQLVAELCGVPIALVSLIDENRQWFKSNCGLTGIDQTGREEALCAHAIMQPGILEIPDAAADPRFARNSLVTGEPYIRFYAGAPLIDKQGMALGTICVIDRKPRRLTLVQRTHLQRLAIAITGLITSRGQNALSRSTKPIVASAL